MSLDAVLVTGATGFIGTHLCDLLARQGKNIRGFAFPGEKTRHLEDLGVKIYSGDLSRPEMVNGICDGIDIVYHLASRVTYWGRKKDFYDAIYVATKNLLDVAADAGVSRFVYVSSYCACGLGGHLKGITEDTPPRKTSIYYGDAKLDAENLVWQYQQDCGLTATVVRPSNVIGPGSVWVKDAIDSYLRSRIFHLIDHGRYSRD